MIEQSARLASKERRSAGRVPLRIATRIEAFDRSIDHCTAGTMTALHDLSPCGVALRHSAGLAIGALVRLRVPAVGWRHVEICWQSDGHAGGRFLLPLLDHEFRAAIHSGRPRERGPRRGAPVSRPATRIPAGRRAAAAVGRWLSRWNDKLVITGRPIATT